MQIRCPHCQNGVEVVEDIDFDSVSCGSCGSQFNLVSESDVATLQGGGFIEQHVEDATGSIGHFDLLEEVGRGAFGTVWRSRDTELERIVAIKIPRRIQESAQEREQFLREARSVAQLSHPNIVNVFEIGREGKMVYIVSDFIEGVSIADAILTDRYSPRYGVELSIKVAGALHHAHERGVIHRDLKPANIMLDKQGEPQVMDFGLAKRDAGEITMTVEGALLGTPAYMSPEQARGEGHHVDRRADVYSLGVILYELLTGERPFRGSMRMLIEQVIHDDAPSPRKLNSTIPRDLETIVLKCLEKDAKGRYDNCDQLSADLQAWLDHKPISARPISVLGRALRWCKRKPVVAAMSISILLVLSVGVAVSSYFAAVAKNEAREAQASALEAKIAVESEIAAKNKAIHSERLAVQAMQAGTRQRVKAEKSALEAHRARASEIEQRKKAEEANRIAVEQAYSSDLLLVDVYWNNANITAMQDILNRYTEVDDQYQLRGFEWEYWNHLANYAESTLVAFNSNASTVVYSPNGEMMVVGSRGGILKLFGTKDGDSICAWTAHKNLLTKVMFSHDSQKIVSCASDKMIYVWKASTGEKLLQIGPTIDGISAIALSPDSAVISAVVGRSLVSWDAITGVMQSQVPFPLRSVSSMEFNADGTKLVFGSFSGLVWVWDVASQKNTLEYTGHRSFGVLAVSFSPDGQRIASGGFDSLVRIWNAENGSDVAVSSRDVHDERIHDVEFSRDGKMVGSVSGDRTLRIWDSSNGAIIDVIKGHASYVWSLSFHPDGRSVATASADGTAKIWNIPVYKVGFSSKGSSLRRHNRECLWVKGINGVRTVALNKEGTILAYNLNHQIVLWDLVNDRELSKLSGHSNGVTSILFFDNDRKIATSSMDNSVKIWDVAKERPILSLDSHTDPNVVLAINYQSRRIATASGKDIRLWDITNGELISKFVGQTDNTGCLAFSPNGLQLASSASNGWIKIWDANTHNEIFFFNSRHQGSSLKISYNSQGNLFAMAGTDGLHLWDSVTWKKQRVLKGHSSQINCFNFFADGKRLLTGSQDKSIKVWNVDNGNQLLTLLQIKGIDTVGVVDVSVSENGNRIATSTRYEIKIFGAAKPIAVSN